jgi:hypothetical protein
MKMKLRSLVIIGCMLAAALPVSAATIAPTSAMMQPVKNALASLNTSTTKPLAGIYSPNATIVDEFAPYTWSGANAGMMWYSDWIKFSKSINMTNAKGTLLKPSAFNQSGERVYLVVPVNFGGTIKGKPVTEHGTWTFTLQRSGSSWRILTQSWGTVSSS